MTEAPATPPKIPTITMSHDQELWRRLGSQPSRRAGRTIEWPVARVYRGAPPARLIEDQETIGFHGFPTFAPVPFALPFDWTHNPTGGRSMEYRLMCLQPADPYIYEAESGNRPAWAWQRAAAIILDWCRHHIAERQRNRASWSDMATGYRAMKLALLIDAVLAKQVTLDAGQRRLLLLAAETHLRDLANPAKLSVGNHGLFQLHGLAVLAQVAWPLPAAAPGLAYAQAQIDRVVDNQFFADGGHSEHTPDYHFFAAAALEQIMRQGWLRSKIYDERAAAISEARNWLRDPKKRVVRIGDIRITGEPAKDTSDYPAERPDFAWRDLRVRVFPQAGYAVCRTERPLRESSMLFFQAAFHSGRHKHRDDLHVELFDRGRPILTDSGSSGRERDSWREYLVSTRAHTTVEVDETSFSRDPGHAYGSGLGEVQAYEDGVVFGARAVHGDLGVTHARSLCFSPRCFLAFEDILTADRDRQFTQWFHFHPHFDVRQDGNDIVARDNFGTYRLVVEPGTHVRLVHGAEAPRRQGWHVLREGEIVPRWAVGVVKSGRHVRFRTTLITATAAVDTDLTAVTAPGWGLAQLGQRLWSADFDKKLNG